MQELQNRITKTLRSHGKIESDDNGLCKIFGEKEYDKIQMIFTKLKEDGKISWYRVGDGTINNIQWRGD